MNANKRYLDLIRIFAMFLVLYGHLVNGASWVTEFPSVFSNEYHLPINDGMTHKAYILDALLGRFNTASAVIGVILFFWLTGYLTAMTRERYTGKVFLMKRIARLYPGLIIAVIICGVVAACLGVKHTFWEYISNGLLLHWLMGQGTMIATLWTLTVELLFYCFVLHFTRLNFKNIMIIDGCILFFTISQAMTGQGSYILIYILKYVPIILFGSMMYEFHRVEGLKRYIELALTAIATYLIPYIAITYVYQGEKEYKSPASYIFALIVWGSFFLLDKLLRKCIRALDQVLNTAIKFFVDTSYLVYLIQLNVGLPIMYFLKQAGMRGAYINIICGVIGTFIVASVVHYLLEKPIQTYLSKKILLWQK